MSEFTRGPLPCQSFTITSPHASPGTPAPLCLSVFSCVLHVCALHGVSPRDRWLCVLPNGK